MYANAIKMMIYKNIKSSFKHVGLLRNKVTIRGKIRPNGRGNLSTN